MYGIIRWTTHNGEEYLAENGWTQDWSQAKQFETPAEVDPLLRELEGTGIVRAREIDPNNPDNPDAIYLV